MNAIRAWVLACFVPLALAGCAGEGVWATDEAVDRVRYSHSAPASLTLVTVIRTAANAGAHTGLIINASERVIWDPAGSFKHKSIPERNDVIHGVSPRILNHYIDYHARSSYHVITQTIEVSPAVAEQALRLAQQAGPVVGAQCSVSTAQILAKLPGFEGFPTSYFPRKSMEAFAALPGVATKEIYDTDDDDNRYLLEVAL